MTHEELVAKAREAKSAEELMELAKAEGMELTEEAAGEYYTMLNPESGEISDDELDNVSGGGCKIKVNGKKYTVVMILQTVSQELNSGLSSARPTR